jgi:beta-lactamase regulating signal transducer with metallopeptidase domain
MNALTNPFVTASAKGGAWLLVWSWQAAVLLACVWAGLKIFRVKSPALRHQVWLIALIAVAAMPILGGVVQNLPLPQPTSRAISYAVELPRIVITNDAAPVVQNPSPAVSVKPSIKRPIILSLSFALWLVGALILVMRAAINGVRLRRLRDGARLTSLADLDCVECDCEALRAGKVRIALSHEIRSPILLGVLRPLIAFPADIGAWTSPMERCAMLRHELAHAERRDHFVNLFQTILGAVFFFHPLARYACRQLTVEREMACDDHVVFSGAEAETYAESIVKAIERSIGTPRGAQQLALFSPRQILERRIEMILNKDRARMITHPWRYMVLSATLIAAVSLLLISSRAGKIAAQPANNDDEQALIAMVRQAALKIPQRINLGLFSYNPNLELEHFVASSGEPTWRTFTGFTRQRLIVTKVKVEDFHVKIASEEAKLDFLSTLYFKDPDRGEEKIAIDRFTVVMMKTDGQWRGVPPPPPPPGPVAGGMKNDLPPPPPPPPPPQRIDRVLLARIYEALNVNISRDASVFEWLFADDYIETGPNGERRNKAQSIAEVKRQDITITNFEIDDYRVAIDGGSAIANFLGKVYHKTNSVGSSTEYRYTCEFVRRNGRWQILALQISGKE